jgi:uncharacterized membrane protein
MSDAPPPAAASPTPPSLDPKEIESGKMMAILSYIPIAMVGLIIAIVTLAQKNNAFALYHAKQALTLYLIGLGASLICIPLLFVCIGGPLMAAVGIASLVFCVLGIVNANAGECKPLPWIGAYAEKWFASIQKP